MSNEARCTPDEALCRARSVVGKGGQYLLGTGDYRPYTTALGDLRVVVDVPWTLQGFNAGSDCAGFAICWAWKIARHRPGFAPHAPKWVDVEDIDDDVNCNSALEDATDKQELFTYGGNRTKLNFPPAPGDLLLYPTIRIHGADGTLNRFIGHVGLIERVPANWTSGQGWTPLSILQCHGPNGFTPGVVRTDGSVFTRHDLNWPKEAHGCHLLRVL